MSKKPEIKIYPDYNFGVKFPNGWREDPINPPTRLHSIKKYQENSQALNQNNGTIKMETLVITFGILKLNTQERQLIIL